MIKVDMSNIRRTVLSALPSGADVDRVLNGLGAAARQRWIKYAQAELRSSSRDYIQGLSEVEVDGRVARIALNGRLPNMVEQGWPETDLRKTLLGPNAKNVKTAADGSRYNTVPFRHGVPGTGGRNVGHAMPGPIYAEAKKLVATLSRPGLGGKPSAVLYGGRLMPHSKMKKEARDILSTKEKPYHLSSIYLGMIKEQKLYEKATQSQYTTFRTISTKVRRAAEHWLHPGIQARNLARKVQKDLEQLMTQFVAGSTKPKGKT